MFRGSLPADVQRILAEAVKAWGTDTIYVGCSGNFTVERALSSIGDFKHHGNDVTIYSSALGSYLAGQPFALSLKPNTPFPWLADYMKTQEDQVATVALSTRLVDSMKTSGETKYNAYYERMGGAYENQFQVMHGKTVTRLKTLEMRLVSYFHGDVMDFVDTVPQGGAFIVYPPFYAGDYTNMFKKLDLLFEWPHPSFKELTDELLKTLYEKVTSKKDWLFGTDTPQKDYQDNLIGIARTTNRGLPMYLYASHGNKRIVTPSQAAEGVMNARLSPGMEIGGKMTLSVLNYKQFQGLRSQYMNAFIKPGQATEAYGVLVDGYLVGVFAVSTAPNPGSIHEPSRIYMLSDFPVAPVDYPRLAKLVLYAAMSKEAKLLYERVAKRKISMIYTTAFSKHPESMKYRGILKLNNRKEKLDEGEKKDKNVDGNANEYYARKFELNYVGQVGTWTLQEGLALWKKKHGERVANANAHYSD
jgi:hypothetical protein